MPERGARAMYERVFVLEVSGPTLELLHERIDHLPNFRRFIREGAWSRLRSPLQPVLPPAFATLLTGKNPGKTGLFDFFKFPAGGYRRIPYSTELLAQEPFYQLLSRRGVRVGLLNVPLTYPLPRVDGFVVSGDEGIDGDYAWPPEVARALDADGYSVPFGASYAPGREVEFARRARDVIAMRQRALARLFEDRTWRFGMLTIHAFGEVLHAFWKFYDRRHPAYVPVARQPGLGDPFLEGFEALDQLLGDIVELTGPRGLVLVLGAWSHRLEHSRVHFNALLEDAGYLRFKRTLPAQLRRLAFRLGITAASAEQGSVYRIPLSSPGAMEKAGFTVIDCRPYALGRVSRLPASEFFEREFADLDVLGDFYRVFAGEAGIAKTLLLPVEVHVHSFVAKIGQGVRLDVTADFFH